MHLKLFVSLQSLLPPLPVLEALYELRPLVLLTAGGWAIGIRQALGDFRLYIGCPSRAYFLDELRSQR